MHFSISHSKSGCPASICPFTMPVKRKSSKCTLCILHAKQWQWRMIVYFLSVYTLHSGLQKGVDRKTENAEREPLSLHVNAFLSHARAVVGCLHSFLIKIFQSNKNPIPIFLVSCHTICKFPNTDYCCFRDSRSFRKGKTQRSFHGAIHFPPFKQ